MTDNVEEFLSALDPRARKTVHALSKAYDIALPEVARRQEVKPTESNSRFLHSLLFAALAENMKLVAGEVRRNLREPLPSGHPPSMRKAQAELRNLAAVMNAISAVKHFEPTSPEEACEIKRLADKSNVVARNASNDVGEITLKHCDLDDQTFH